MNSDISKPHHSLFLPSESDSQAFAGRLARCLKPGAVLTFQGDLGAGKTTMIRALLRALGIRSAIKSPSYSLIESYVCPAFELHHFDLYRIQEDYELDYLGFRDYFSDQTVCCIEWPEKGGESMPPVDLRFVLSMQGKGRQLQIQAASALGQAIVNCLEASQ